MNQYLLGQFYYSTARALRKCFICNTNIIAGTKHLAKNIPTGTSINRANFCKKCAIITVDKLEKTIQQMKLKVRLI